MASAILPQESLLKPPIRSRGSFTVIAGRVHSQTPATATLTSFHVTHATCAIDAFRTHEDRWLAPSSARRSAVERRHQVHSLMCTFGILQHNCAVYTQECYDVVSTSKLTVHGSTLQRTRCSPQLLWMPQQTKPNYGCNRRNRQCTPYMLRCSGSVA